MTAIVDNTKRRVGDFLRERIEAGSDLSIVSAYFTIFKTTLEELAAEHGEQGCA